MVYFPNSGDYRDTIGFNNLKKNFPKNVLLKIIN